MDVSLQKKAAAEKAVEYIENNMIVGLGTGSTFYFALLKIAELINSGSLKNIKCIPSSKTTEELAKENGIPLTSFNEYQSIDLTIDGADEVDENLNLIKGGGGALLREKILVQASKKFIVAIDESKFSKKLGKKFYVPIEVFPFAESLEIKYLQSLGAKVKMRKSNDNVFLTDQRNIILECDFGEINDLHELENKLNKRAGIAEHGLFIGFAHNVVIGKSDANNEIYTEIR